MKGRFKRMFMKVLVSLMLILGIIISLSLINHHVKLSKEKKLIVPLGNLVEINNHQMHVYTEGRGEETLVFMSGGGTSSPVLDFKSLFTLFSDSYKIAVVEKAGYGFSDITNEDRE